MKHLLVTGNSIDGLMFYGPFDSVEEAVEYAEKFHNNMEWCVGELKEPVKE